MDLHEQVVLVTDASGGLGTFVTNAFLDASASVVGVSPSTASSEFPSPQFVGIARTITNGESARTLVAEVVSKRNRLDVLVHLVGAFAGGESSPTRTTQLSTGCSN